MIPVADQQVVQPFQAVSNRAETGKPLIGMMKLAAVSLFHDFGEHRPRNFNRDRPADLKIPGGLPPENGETAKRRALYPAITMVCPFHPV